MSGFYKDVSIHCSELVRPIVEGVMDPVWSSPLRLELDVVPVLVLTVVPEYLVANVEGYWSHFLVV